MESGLIEMHLHILNSGIPESKLCLLVHALRGNISTAISMQISWRATHRYHTQQKITMVVAIIWSAITAQAVMVS